MIQKKFSKILSKEKFFSRLNNKEMSDQIYRHVQRVWNKFNTVEYVSVYNITEVVQVLGVVVLKIMHGKFNLNPLD